MPRIITVTDEDLSVKARIHIDKDPDTGESQITKLELSALGGRGIRSADLLILQDLGLRLPDPTATLTPVDAVVPRAPTPALGPVPHQRAGTDSGAKPARKSPTSKLRYTIGKGGRTYYERPSPHELMALYAEMDYSGTKVAQYYGIDTARITAWIVRLRKQGYDFPRTRRRPDSSPATLPLPPAGEVGDAAQQS